MEIISLTQEHFAVVDNDDFDWLFYWKWHYSKDRKQARTGYAGRTQSLGRGKTLHVRMAVEIMKRHGFWQPGCSVCCLNRCGTDNRKENLRCVTRVEIQHLRGRTRKNTSGYTGVIFSQHFGKWLALMKVGEEVLYLGSFSKRDDAICARQEAERTYHGDFQCDPVNVCPLESLGQCVECTERLRTMSLGIIDPQTMWQRKLTTDRIRVYSNHGRWCVVFRGEHLGTFSTEEEAERVYVKAIEKFYGDPEELRELDLGETSGVSSVVF